MDLVFEVSSEEVIADLEGLGNIVREELNATITRLTIQLSNNIKTNKLSGQALKVKTGRLRNSIHAQTTVSSNKVVGTVSTNVSYAAAHEYGFVGPEVVKAHLRNIKQAFGQAITPQAIAIRSFSRTANMPERSFMRSALEEFKPTIFSEIDNVIQRAINK